MPNSIQKILFFLVLLLAGLVIGSSLLGYALFHFDVITSDGWSFYDRLLGQPLWLGAWKSWSGHRLVFPGLLQYANLTWFGANLSNLIIIDVAAIVVSAWLLAHDAAGTLAHHSSRWLLMALTLAVLLWMGNRDAMTWAFGLTYTLGVLGAVAGCYCMARSNGSASRNFNWAWLIAALAGALLATFSWGSGLAMWPTLVLMALALQLPRRALLTVVFCSAVVITVYFIPVPGEDSMAYVVPPPSFHVAVPIIYKTVGVLGNMPTHLFAPSGPRPPHALTVFARGMGFLGLLLSGGLVYLWWHQRASRRWLLPVAGIVLFSIGTAFTIGLARVWGAARLGYENYGMPDRYTIFSSLFWAALLCGYIPLAAQHFRWRRHAFVVALFTTVALLILLPSQAHDFIRAGTKKNHIEEASIAYAIGVMDTGKFFYSGLGLWHPQKRVHLTQYLKKNRLNIFSRYWTGWMGTHLTGTNRNAKQVKGALTRAQRVDSGWRLQGWLATPHRGALVVGVDRHGRIRAIARLTEPLDDSHNARHPLRGRALRLLYGADPGLPAIFGWGRGWYGYAVGRINPHKLRYLVVNREKRIIARIR